MNKESEYNSALKDLKERCENMEVAECPITSGMTTEEKQKKLRAIRRKAKRLLVEYLTFDNN